MASAFYNILDERKGGLGVDLGFKMKLPTADEQVGLGTGETDYAFQADFFKPFGATTLFGSIGYRIYGDPPAGRAGRRALRLHRPVAAHLRGCERGRGLRLPAEDHPGGSEISELTAFWSKRVSPEWKWQLYGVVGFSSDASPDAGAGVLLERRF